MNAEVPIVPETRPRWRRRLSVALRRNRHIALLEILSVVALIAMVTISYFIVTQQGSPQALLTPPMVAILLVANLVPAMALMVLAARRVAVGRAAKSPMGGRGRLHVRLVAIFSVVASVPTLLVVIFASLLFQQGVQLWFSDRAPSILESADMVEQL